MVARAVETGYVDFNEVMDMTPYEMAVTIRGRQAVEEREVERNKLFFGSLISTYLNMHSGKNARKYKWSDVFASGKQESEMSDEEIERRLDALERLFSED